MSTAPTKRSNQKWQIESGEDFFQCLGPSGRIVCWLDADGAYQPQSTVQNSIPPTKFVTVDGSRTDSYTPNGSVSQPFKTITAAVNQIILNGDNATRPYVVNIAPGIYPETIDLSNPALMNVSFYGNYSAVVGGASFDAPLVQAINNDNLTDVNFVGITFAQSGSSPHSFIFSSTTNGTLFGNSNEPGINFYDCVIRASSDFYINNCGAVTWDRCYITATINVTNCILALVKGGTGLNQGSQFNVFTVAGPAPAGFSASQIQVQNATCQATISIDVGSSFIASMGSRVRNTITVNGIFTSRASHTSGSIVVNSGGTYKEDGGAGHTGSITLNGTGVYVQTGTYGIGTLVLNGAQISTGSVAPNGAVIGNLGDLYLNKLGGAGTTLWVKESGINTNTGWIGK